LQNRCGALFYRTDASGCCKKRFDSKQKVGGLGKAHLPFIFYSSLLNNRAFCLVWYVIDVLRMRELGVGDLLVIDLGGSIRPLSETAMSSDADFSTECREA
jgi:hypothetical protein